MMRRHQRSAAPARDAFTLVELLVVIGLILILVTITVSISANLLTGAKEKATRATIAKVHQLLEDRRRAIDIHNSTVQFDQEIRFLRSRVRNIVANAIQGGTLTQNAGVQIEAAFQRALPAMVVKAKLRQLLPQANLTGPPPTVADSSELLYEALTQREVFGVEPVGEEFFDTSELGDTDGDGITEIIDAWGHPLRFYVWPTRLVRPDGLVDADTDGIIEIPNQSGLDETLAGLNGDNVDLLVPGAARQNLNVDPDDPMGYFLNFVNMLTRAGAVTNGYQRTEMAPVTPVDFPTLIQGYPTLATYHVPLIVSIGPDEVPGLFEPYDVANFGHLAQPDPANAEALYDDITNHQTPSD
jgi:prepilin-type N-terminal cleavage/methylation domain-containing protein